MPSGYYIETGGVEWGEEGGRQTDRQTESYYQMIILYFIIEFINTIKLIKQYILTWIKMAC